MVVVVVVVVVVIVVDRMMYTIGIQKETKHYFISSEKVTLLQIVPSLVYDWFIHFIQGYICEQCSRVSTCI